MQEVMEELKRRLPGTSLWYLLYADDLVFICDHSDVQHTIVELRRTSLDFGLRLNEAKSGVFAVGGHEKLGLVGAVEGIPVLNQYRYLGVLVDDRGTIHPHLTALKARSRYLCGVTWSFARELSFANQVLLWQVYLLPYFCYVSPALHTQTAT